MPKRNIIVIGASAGGVKALVELVKSLPKNFKGSVFIVVHVAPTWPSRLPEILSWRGDLKAIHPKDGEKIKTGMIYIAPPDHHLLVERNQVLVKKGPKENRFRPSIDALFRSAAYVYGPRVIGVVLTGMLSDGTSGLWSVKRLGGITIIQDPNDAAYPSMPQNVLEYVDVDYAVPLAQIGELLIELTTQTAPEQPNITVAEMKYIKQEIVIATHDNAFDVGVMNMGELTSFTCPDCHGALISIKEGKSIRYRCHTGHAFTATALLEGVTESVEEALWSSVRALEETYMLLKKIADQYNEVGNTEEAGKFLKKSEEVRNRSRILQRTMFSDELLSADILSSRKNGGSISLKQQKKSMPVKRKTSKEAVEQ